MHSVILLPVLRRSFKALILMTTYFASCYTKAKHGGPAKTTMLRYGGKLFLTRDQNILSSLYRIQPRVFKYVIPGRLLPLFAE